MPLTLNKPYKQNGIDYPFCALKSLIITGVIKTIQIDNVNQQVYDANCVLEFVPFRNKEDGIIEELDVKEVKVYRHMFEIIDSGDIVIGQASQYIFSGLQTIINGYNLFNQSE